MRIKDHNLDNALIVEIGKFSILWNCFERFQCDNNCNAKEIRSVCSRISIDKDKQAELTRVLNERRSWFGQTIPEHVKTGLYPGNARQNRPEDRIAMEQFMKQEGDNLCQGCLLVIFRIRNNLMHGLKCIEQLNDQLELFKAVNGVLEPLDWKN